MSMIRNSTTSGTLRRRTLARSSRRGGTRLGVESLENRALLAAMTFDLVNNTGLDSAKYSIYAMGSNFTTDPATNWYLNDQFSFVSGIPANNVTPSYKVTSNPTIHVPDNSGLAGVRVYFFVVPEGGVASAAVSPVPAAYGYTSVPSVTFPKPDSGVQATGHAVLRTVNDPIGGNTSVVDSIVVDNPGSGYTSPPVPIIAAPGAVETVTLATGGSGYPNGSTFFTIDGSSTSSPANVQATISGGVVTGVSLQNRGSGYSTVMSPQNINLGSGTGGKVNVTLVTAPTATSTLYGNEGPSFAIGTQPANPPGFPFVYQFVEFTSVAGGSNTVDLQTVDGFTFPITITAGKANTNQVGYQYGQPVENPLSPTVTRTSIFSTFTQFMTAQGTAGSPYLDLPYTLESGLIDGEKGGILSPDIYLTTTNAAGDYLHLKSPLDTSFDAPLSTLFSAATTKLSLKGVPQGAIAEQIYSGSYSASVPFPQTSGVNPGTGAAQPISLPAITFTGTSNTFHVFDPIGLSVLKSTDGDPLTGKVTTVTGTDLGQIATLHFDVPLPTSVQPGWFVNGNGLSQGVGSNPGNAITPWYVTAVTNGGRTVSVAKTAVNGNIPGSAVTTTVSSQYQFSQLPYVSMMLTPGQMAFGNSGVFADNSLQFTKGSDEATVLGNLEYQIVAALNRGVLLLSDALSPANPGDTSVAWFTEKRWYPVGKTQNLFSLFMHTGAVGTGATAVPIFTHPLNALPIHGPNGPKMGAAYGFPFDETPGAGYVQVPSKFDGNIGPGALPTDIVITFGPWATTTPSTDPKVEAPNSFRIYSETGPLNWTKAGQPLDVISNVPAEETVLVTMSALPTSSVPTPKFTWTSAAGVVSTLVTGGSVVYLEGTKAAINAALAQLAAPLGFDYALIPPASTAVNLTISAWRKPGADWAPFDSAFSVVDNLPVYPLVVDVPGTPQPATVGTPVSLDLPHEMFADPDPTANIYHIAIFSVSASGTGTGEFGYAAKPTGPSVSSWNASGPMSGPSDGVPQSISLFGTIQQINQYVSATAIQFKATTGGQSKIDVTLLRLAVSSTTGGWIVIDSETKEMRIDAAPPG